MQPILSDTLASPDQSDLSSQSNNASLLSIIAAVAIGMAIQLHDGEYSSGAMLLVTIALLAVLMCVISPAPSRDSCT